MHAADEKTGELWGTFASPVHGNRIYAIAGAVAAQSGAAEHRSWSLTAGASLKLTILNPKGRVWTMVRGKPMRSAALMLGACRVFVTF